MKKTYEITQEMANDIKTFQTLPLERASIFMQNSLHDVIQSDRYSDKELCSKSVYGLCANIIKILEDNKIEYGILKLPSSLAFAETPGEDTEVYSVPIVAESYLVNLQDIKSLAKFIHGSNKCIWLYKVSLKSTFDSDNNNSIIKPLFMNENDEFNDTDEFTLRCALLLHKSIPTFFNSVIKDMSMSPADIIRKFR